MAQKTVTELRKPYGFAGHFDYLTHDFNFLAELKYEKPTDFNRVLVGFFHYLKI